MDVELKAFTENQTWTLADLPPAKVPICCRWWPSVTLRWKALITLIHSTMLPKLPLLESSFHLQLLTDGRY